MFSGNPRQLVLDSHFTKINSMRRSTATLPELAHKEREHRPTKCNDAEQPEAIEKCIDCGLTLDQSLHLSESVRGRVGCREAVLHELAGETAESGFQAEVRTGDVRRDHSPVKLCSSLENCRHKGNAEAAALIAKQIRQTRRFVVLALGQVRVGQLAGRHK